MTRNRDVMIPNCSRSDRICDLSLTLRRDDKFLRWPACEEMMSRHV